MGRRRSRERGGIIRSALAAALAPSSRSPSDPHATHTTSGYPSRAGFGGERDHQSNYGGIIRSALASAFAPSSRPPSDPYAAHTTSGYPSRAGFGDEHDHQSNYGGGRSDRGGGGIIRSALASAFAPSSRPPSDPHSSRTMSGVPSRTGFGGEHQYQNIHGVGDTAPPAYQSEAPPASGYRIPLATDHPLPANLQDIGQPPFYDPDGVSPIYIGSAVIQDSIQPCRIGPHLRPYGHNGRYDLLPFRPHEMEWVQTSRGQIPHGRRPIEGGHEEKGAKLYHAAALINGVKVPGKAGEHLGGACVSFGGFEHEVSDNYELLCWR